MSRQQKLLVIEVFAGLLPGANACRELGLEADHVYIEWDDHAEAISCVQWPDATKLAGKSDINDVTADDIVKLVDSYDPSKILYMGGPPCQDVSRLAGRRR